MVCQQVWSFRSGRRRVATWGLTAERRVYISNPTAPLNPYAAPSLSPTQVTLRTTTQVQWGQRKKFAASNKESEHEAPP